MTTRWRIGFAALWLVATATIVHADPSLAPTGTLRAVYLATNPAQAVRDAASGDIRGVAKDMTVELGRRIDRKIAIAPSDNPQTVIDAVAKGEADIGFVAYAPSRTGTVEFSQTYMLVRQTFIVKDASPLRSVNDIDRAGLRLSGGKGDSITLFLGRTLKQATLVQTDGTPADTKRKFDANEIDAFGANRQRLTTMLQTMPGYRLLPDNVFDVPQTIVVAKGNMAALGLVNRMIDETRMSGFLKTAMDKSGIVGIDVAPAGYGYGRAE